MRQPLHMLKGQTTTDWNSDSTEVCLTKSLHSLEKRSNQCGCSLNQRWEERKRKKERKKESKKEKNECCSRRIQHFTNAENASSYFITLATSWSTQR
jgi:hypothetical protein